MLLVQRGKALGYGKWSLPGGKQEDTETAHAAASRELWEEAGVVADLRHHVGDFEIATATASYRISCFTGHYMSGDARAGDDAMAVAWAHHTEINNRDLAPNIVEAVALARKLISL